MRPEEKDLFKSVAPKPFLEISERICCQIDSLKQTKLLLTFLRVCFHKSPTPKRHKQVYLETHKSQRQSWVRFFHKWNKHKSNSYLVHMTWICKSNIVSPRMILLKLQKALWTPTLQSGSRLRKKIIKGRCSRGQRQQPRGQIQEP